MIYLIVFIFLLLCTINDGIVKSIAADRLRYWTLCGILVLLAGLRYRVGGDSLAYMDNFNALPKLSDLENFDFVKAEYDPLWYIFNASIKSVFDNFIFFQIVHAVIINSIVFWFTKKYTVYKYTVILFYYIFFYLYFNMEILRESLSLCVFFLSIPYLLKGKWVHYYLINIVAFLFHSSAIITFFIPLLFRKLNWFYYLLLTAVVLLFTFIKPYELFSLFDLNGRINRKINTYTTYDINIFGQLTQMMVVIPIIGIKIIRRICRLNEHRFEKIITSYIVIGILSGVIGGFYRFLNYLSIVSIIYLVDTFKTIYKYKTFYFKDFIITQLCLLLLFFHQGFYMLRDTSEYQPGTRFYNRYLPYYSVFNERKDMHRERLYFNQMGMPL